MKTSRSTIISGLICLVTISQVSAIRWKLELDNDLLSSQIDVAFRKANQIGAIHRLYVTETLHGEDQNIKMEYYYMPGYIEKEKETQQQKRSYGTLNPFIDIEKGLFIRNFGSTHTLLFNKYNLFDKHLLLISKRFQLQDGLLDQLDFTYASYACQALSGIVLFNGGKNSGSSQDHKHIQIVPSQAKELPIYAAIADYVQNNRSASTKQPQNIFTFPHLPFLHGIISFHLNVKPLGTRLFQAYQMLHQQLITSNQQKYLNISDYNFIGSESFAMLVPRSREKAENTISINSIGFLGALLFKENTYMQTFYQEHTPTEVLREITYP